MTESEEGCREGRPIEDWIAETTEKWKPVLDRLAEGPRGTAGATYRALVTHESDRWVAVVEGLLGGATEAARLSDLEVEVRDLVAGLLDRDESTFDLQWERTSALGPDEQAEWDAFLRGRPTDIASMLAEEGRVVEENEESGVQVRDLSEVRITRGIGENERVISFPKDA